MEDITVARRGNRGRSVQRLGLGNYIRMEREYRELFEAILRIDRREISKCGFMQYEFFACRPKAIQHARLKYHVIPTRSNQLVKRRKINVLFAIPST
jgi:hypothetical protein